MSRIRRGRGRRGVRNRRRVKRSSVGVGSVSEKEVLLKVGESSSMCGVIICAVDVFSGKGSGMRGGEGGIEDM